MLVLKLVFISGCMVGIEFIESKTDKIYSFAVVVDLFIFRVIVKKVKYVG